MIAGLDRRRFFTLAGAAALLPAAFRRFRRASDVPISKRRLLQMNGYATDAETPLDALTTYLTPNDLFFVRHHWNPTLPRHRRRWTLTVDGEVERPLRAHARRPEEDAPRERDLRPAVRGQRPGSLQAGRSRASSGSYGAVGNARWTGFASGPSRTAPASRPAGATFTPSAADKPPVKILPFHRSVEIEKVLEDGLVAWEMNGEPLAPSPRRAGAAGRAGLGGDHWMKWLERLIAAARAAEGLLHGDRLQVSRAAGEPGVAFKPDEMRAGDGALRQVEHHARLRRRSEWARRRRSADSRSPVRRTSRRSRSPTTAAGPGSRPR